MNRQGNHRKSFMQLMSHPAWAGISGIVAILTLLWGFVTFVPQAAPIRTGIAQMVSGTPVPTDTSTSPPAPIPTLPPLASTKTISENIVLKCNDCSDPVVVTITSIKIEPQNNRMIWTLLLFNNSALPQNCLFEQFSLQNPLDDKTFGSTMPYCSELPVGEKTSINAIFSFIPYTKVAYTLNASIYDRNALPLPFLPVQVTF